MVDLFRQSMFYDVFFKKEKNVLIDQELSLNQKFCYKQDPNKRIEHCTWVVFDFETTGLDPLSDRVIELGARKILNGKCIGEFSTLVSIPQKLPKIVTKISGIESYMLEGMPTIDQVLPSFLDFSEGCILVAHNAAFDQSFLKAEAKKFHIEIDWPIICTLKMARLLLPDLERKNLDSLAAHYKLSFESRHRSIGDVKVTTDVLLNLLEEHKTRYILWKDLHSFQV
jgi:DNA polymerase III epsilon subunit family exonuclease